RSETSDAGGAIMTGLDWFRVADALNMIKRKLSNGFYARRRSEFFDFDVSEKVAQIVASYVDYVNRGVWRKK
ncbi:MAG: hypothetical protein II655_13530, partial [Thermoguttaceae bacterium]|nr:hypothetical protein [Thermoguttaceae bacterium]